MPCRRQRFSEPSSSTFAKEIEMLELHGRAEFSVIENSTSEEEIITLTAKDFQLEKRPLLRDGDILDLDEKVEDHVAECVALGFEFRVVATPPNELRVEVDSNAISVTIVENDFSFDEAVDDEISDDQDDRGADLD
jgi:hypothetical protein